MLFPVSINRFVSVKTLLDKTGRDYDFVNIDTEGNSNRILKQMLAELNGRAKMICVEAEGTDMEQALESAGYKFIHRSRENFIFAKDKDVS